MKIPRDKIEAASSGGVRRVLLALTALIVLLARPAPVAAQEVRPFKVEGLHGAIEAGLFTNLEDRTRSISSGSQFDRAELSQLLHLETDGYIYHPEFLTFDTGLKLELIESLYGQGGNRFLWGGNWRFNFLKNRKNSLSVYGSRLESEFARPFAEFYRVTNELYGATFFQKWGWIPFDLSFQHGKRSGGVGNQLDDSFDRVIFDGRYRLSERSDGRLEYDLSFEDIQDKSFRRQNLVANNVTYLGETNDKRWSTNLRLFEERNDHLRRDASGSTELDWTHSSTLQTRYLFRGRWSDNELQNSTTLDPSFFLNHQLYESLRTDVELFAHLENASYRDWNEFGGRIAESYVKRLGTWGQLNVVVAPRVAVSFNRSKQDTAFVTDEARTMVDLQPAVLTQANIIVSSIVVTDLTGSIVYVEGPLGDYVVNQIGGGVETELVRTPISNIADGEVVLVDYEYELLGDNDTLASGVNISTSLAFLERWTAYGRYDSSDYHVLSGDKSALRFNNFDRYVAGLRYGGPWLNAKAEFEENDADLGSYRGFASGVTVFTYSTKSWSGRLNADYGYRDNMDTGENVNRFAVSGSAGTRLFRRGFLEAEGSYLWARWSGESSQANDVDAMNVKLKYSWWYGKVEVRMETGFAQLLRPTEDRRVYKFDLWVRRVF